MTPETNKLIIRRFTGELINTASASLAVELFALYVAGNPDRCVDRRASCRLSR
jgi:hypothetical protein